ncbi:MAG TPA: Rnf-Nqr domain containing protein, partial [Bacteroidales bacterium]|nr:Rnf-Nqr domain containing protein [Bacteroidales bacterium]
PSFLDGIFNGFGYGLVLIIVGVIREVFGSGTLWNIQVIPTSFYEAGYMNNGLMMLPPMALLLVGIMIWIQRS